MGVFKQSWNGTAALWQAFWLVYFLMGCLVGILTGFLAYKIAPHMSEEWQRNLSIAMAYPYTVFGAICVWRCGKNAALLWNILAKIVVTVAVIFGFYTILKLI